MPSPRQTALEILTAANSAPQLLELERQRAARGAQTAQLIGGTVQTLIPQLANAGGQLYGMAEKNATDAGNADTLAHYGDIGGPAPAAGAAGDDLDALAKVRAGVTAPAAPGGYAQGAGAYAQKLADDNPDLKPGTGLFDQLLGNGLKAKRREAFLSSAVPQIAKQRADAQAASEHAVDRANALDESNIKRTTERTNAAKDILGATALPPELGHSDLARLTSDPTAPDMIAPFKSRDQQFYEANKSALDALGIGSAFGQNLAGGNLASRDAAAAKEAEAQKEVARARDIQTAAEKEQERANRARENISYAEMSQHAKDAAANRQAELDRAKVVAGAREDKPQAQVFDAMKPYEETYGVLQGLLDTPAEIKNQALGRGGATQNNIAQFMKIDDPKITGFRSQIANQLNESVHKLTGSAYSDAEFRRLLAGVANESNSAQSFDEKVKNAMARLKLLQDADKRTLAAAGYNVSRIQPLGQASSAAPASAPQLSMKQQLVDAMLSQQMTPDQIQAELTRRGF